VGLVGWVEDDDRGRVGALYIAAGGDRRVRVGDEGSLSSGLNGI
jgi:hypothetical protein